MSLESTLAEALDPVAFARGLGIEPEAWQVDALRSSHRRQLFACSRQAGKSTVASIASLHTALFRDDALVLLVSPGERQSLLLLRRVLAYYRKAGSPVELVNESATRLEFSNGSQVIGLPSTESRIRGYAKPDLVVIDEAARVEDDLYFAVRPMLATGGGRLIAASTPFGPSGWFAAAWRSEGDEWEKHRVVWSDVKHLDRAEVDFDRRSMPSAQFAAEYEVSFSDDFAGQAFAYEVVARCVDEGAETWTLTP